MGAPSQLRIGDSWRWTRSADVRRADDGWTLTYYVKNRAAEFSIVASADGAHYVIAVASSASKAFAPGVYTWAEVLTKDAERYTEDIGETRLLPNFADGGVIDTRSDSRRRLEAVEAVLDNIATFEQLEVTIGTTALKKMPRGELLRWRDLLKQEVRAEERAARAAKGLPRGDQIYVRFRKP